MVRRRAAVPCLPVAAVRVRRGRLQRRPGRDGAHLRPVRCRRGGDRGGQGNGQELRRFEHGCVRADPRRDVGRSRQHAGSQHLRHAARRRDPDRGPRPMVGQPTAVIGLPVAPLRRDRADLLLNRGRHGQELHAGPTRCRVEDSRARDGEQRRRRDDGAFAAHLDGRRPLPTIHAGGLGRDDRLSRGARALGPCGQPAQPRRALDPQRLGRYRARVRNRHTGKAARHLLRHPRRPGRLGGHRRGAGPGWRHELPLHREHRRQQRPPHALRVPGAGAGGGRRRRSSLDRLRRGDEAADALPRERGLQRRSADGRPAKR